MNINSICPKLGTLDITPSNWETKNVDQLNSVAEWPYTLKRRKKEAKQKPKRMQNKITFGCVPLYTETIFLTNKSD